MGTWGWGWGWPLLWWGWLSCGTWGLWWKRVLRYGGYGLGYGGYGLGYGGYGLGYGGYGLGYGGYGLGYGGYPPISIPETPPVYIEQQDFVKSTAESQKNYWYYCQDPAGYYPYIRECPNGWLPVSPQPLNK
ncbi:MAG: hypothetical protein NTY92_03645 [Nitrosospira sp.]|nr:hypothetical protein [Nitrosospira sp.]